jgi:hypothetical protein
MPAQIDTGFVPAAVPVHMENHGQNRRQTDGKRTAAQ